MIGTHFIAPNTHRVEGKQIPRESECDLDMTLALNWCLPSVLSPSLASPFPLPSIVQCLIPVIPTNGGARNRHSSLIFFFK